MNGFQLVSEALSDNQSLVKLYHLTHPKNEESIKKNGLKISYADVTGKGNLFSIPKWWLHTNIPAIYLSKDLHTDIDSTDPSTPKNPLVIECYVPIINLRLDEDDIKWMYAGKILEALGYKDVVPRNYVGWNFDKIRNNEKIMSDLKDTYQNPKNIAYKLKINEKIIKAITINIIVTMFKKNSEKIRKEYKEGMLIAIEDSKTYIKKYFNHPIKGNKSYISIKDISPNMIRRIFIEKRDNI